MNPATDVGKRDLPGGLRNRFTELYVNELSSREDLETVVRRYADVLSLVVSQLLTGHDAP